MVIESPDLQSGYPAHNGIVDWGASLGYDLHNEGSLMKAADAVRTIARESAKSLADLARDEGISPQAVHRRLEGGCTVATLCKMLGALDYEVVAMPKGSEAPEGSVRIEG